MKTILLILISIFVASCYNKYVVFPKYSTEKTPTKATSIFLDRNGNYYPINELSSFRKGKNKAMLIWKYAKKEKFNIRKKISKADSTTFNNEQDAIIAEQARNINKLVVDNSYKSVTFILVGFNNDYDANGTDSTCSNLKLEKQIKFIETNYPKNQTLFVKVFWDGRHSKRIFGTLKNFSYATATSYMVGYNLRKLISKLESKDINFISHSLGANVVCEAIFNQQSKVTDQDDFRNDLIAKQAVDSVFIKDKNIKAALIAPAMPGSNTFVDFFNKKLNKNLTTANVKFLIGYSEFDKTLSKISRKHFAAKFGSTTLGCSTVELQNVIDTFRTHELISNLDTVSFNNNPIIKGVTKTHDISNYLSNKEAYKKVLNFLFSPAYTNLIPAKSSSVNVDFITEYKKIYNETHQYDSAKLKVRRKDYFQSKDHNYVNTAGNLLMKLLYKEEEKTNFDLTINPQTRTLISRVTDPFVMVLLERSIKEDLVKDNIITPDSTYFFKYKILKEVTNQMNLMMKSKYPYYTYETQKKQPIKFFSVSTGNDLFSRFATNYDRDYTGSLLVEIGTDYLNPLRRRPIKSYQTLLYGFDVFTPLFTDTTKFTKSTSQDSLDRPHASFQYFGWSKKALSKYGNLRWSTTLKLGKIGGRVGAEFQSLLHQDVSYSPRPKGWNAQISNGGRLGISFETKHEFQKILCNNISNANSFTNFNFIPFVELKVGTYMTNSSVGFAFSNKKFNQNNHNFINHRTRQGVISFFDHFMYNISIKSTYVVHNTMLEGFGYFKTSDQDIKQIDNATPKSPYVLQYSQVRRITFTSNFCLSYTTRYFTVLYNYFVFSPETKLGSLKTSNPYSSNLNLKHRWHHFAVIGVSFNIH
jgi:hypothetical protein